MTETMTLLICGECGQGNYFHAGHSLYTCTNPICDHTVAPWDVALDAGERLVSPSFGLVGYVTDEA